MFPLVSGRHVYLLLLYDISISWLNLLNGKRFYFLLAWRENHQFPTKNAIKRDAHGEKGMLSCCKCLFEQMEDNLPHIQAKTVQNVQNVRFFQKSAFVNG